MWVRDPVRLTCLLIAVIVGAAACAIPLVTHGTHLLLPYAGILSAVIAGACACNLYGNDGTSLWLTVMTPGATRADIRGRQAWLIVVALTAAVPVLFLLATQLGHMPWLSWVACQACQACQAVGGLIAGQRDIRASTQPPASDPPGGRVS